MWNTASLGLLGSTLACLSLMCPTPASAALSHELRCRRAIERALNTWVQDTVEARRQCQEDILTGRLAATVDCVTGAGSAEMRQAFADAGQRMRRDLVSRCDSADWGLLSFPGPCGGDPVTFGASELAACIEELGGESETRLFQFWSPTPIARADGIDLECYLAVPKRASRMVLRELKTRLRCLVDAERKPSSTDCRGQLAPYGTGTGDSRLDKRIFRAQWRWLGGLPDACAKADFATLGFGAFCPTFTTGSGLAQFQGCVFRANRVEIPILADLAFPSGPVCGNGIVQEGEACDDGAGNSNTTPNACREYCTLPFCGDGTADSGYGEQCDDGNDSDLDGCTPDCVLEFCGDGTVNDLPNETCDDGNASPNDTCTATCKVATCGDGILCSDASCTSGPDGGPEECDRGPLNAAGGLCEPDCSGFARTCVLRIGVTNAVNLGALTYDFIYSAANGAVVGLGGQVQCRSLVTGGLVSFFDNDLQRKVRESLIVDAGFQTPGDIAECNYVTSDDGLAPSDFSFAISVASDPDFNPVNITLAVTSLACE